MTTPTGRRRLAIVGVLAASVWCSGQTVVLVARAAGSAVEVSSDGSGTDANAHSSAASVDRDGGLIAFESDATNLLPAGQDTNGLRDIFVKAIATGAVTRVSVSSSGRQSNGNSYAASIDAAGDVVAYDSTARNLDDSLPSHCATGTGDCNGKQDVFIHNLRTGVNRLISRAYAGTRSGDGTSTAPIISADGSTVVYQSNDDDLTCSAPPCTGESAKYWNLYSYSVASGITTLLTPAENGDSKFPWPDGSGATVAFYSTATNLIGGATQSGTQVYEWTQSGIVLVSHDPASTSKGGSGVSRLPMMSTDGTTIVYDSSAADITGSRITQAVAFDTATGANSVISACQSACAGGGTAGSRGNAASGLVYSDSAGDRIAFVSSATNISATAPGDGKKSLFVWTATSGPVWEDAGNVYVEGPAIAGGGGTVAWTQATTSGFDQPSARVYCLTLS